MEQLQAVESHDGYFERRIPVLIIPSNKGGVGKTTLAIHISARTAGGKLPKSQTVRNALFAAESEESEEKITLPEGFRALFIDLDPQCNGSAAFIEMPREGGHRRPPLHPQWRPEHGSEQNWNGRLSSTEIYEYQPGAACVPYPTYIDNLSVVPGDSNQIIKALSSLDEANNQTNDDLTINVHTFLDMIEDSGQYDIVIFDLPPGKPALSVAAYRVATHALIPVEMSPFAVDGLPVVLSDIETESKSFGGVPTETIGIVANKVQQINKQSDTLAGVKAKYPEMLLPEVLGLRTSYTLDLAPSTPVGVSLKDKKADKEMKALMEVIDESLSHFRPVNSLGEYL